MLSYFEAQSLRFQLSLQKWSSMDFVALHFAKHVNFVNLFYPIRMWNNQSYYHFGTSLSIEKNSEFLCFRVMIRREILQEAAPCLVDSICAYRGGYIAEVGVMLMK